MEANGEVEESVTWPNNTPGRHGGGFIPTDRSASLPQITKVKRGVQRQRIGNS